MPARRSDEVAEQVHVGGEVGVAPLQFGIVNEPEWRPNPDAVAFYGLELAGSTGAPIEFSSPALASAVVYVGSDDYKLYSFRLKHAFWRMSDRNR